MKHRQNRLIYFQYFLYYIKNIQTINETIIQPIGLIALLLKNVTKICFASKRTQTAAARSQLRSRLLSSNDFTHRRGVAISITVSISAVQTHTPDVDADEMSNSRRSPRAGLRYLGALGCLRHQKSSISSAAIKFSEHIRFDKCC